MSGCVVRVRRLLFVEDDAVWQVYEWWLEVAAARLEGVALAIAGPARPPRLVFGHLIRKCILEAFRLARKIVNLGLYLLCSQRLHVLDRPPASTVEPNGVVTGIH